MNRTFRDDLEKLADFSGKWCVSLFLPTHRKGPETRQDPIRLKNLLGQAETQLVELGLRSPEARKALAPPQELLEDNTFWKHQEEGLALFLAPEFFHQLRLPRRVDELAVVAERFHLKPLLPLLDGEGEFLVLALSQNGVRLLRGTRYSVEELETDGLPKSLADALRFDDPERQLQFHTRASGQGQTRDAMYHGHEEGTEAKDRLLRYFRKVDRGVCDLLGNDHSPLVLAGVEYYFPIYREANNYPHLLKEGIPGNPESLRPDELQARAWDLVQPVFQQAHQQARAQYQQFHNTERTLDDPQEVVLASMSGRVDTLFVSVGQQLWGAADLNSNTIHWHDQPQPGDQDLLDVAAVQTFLKKGKVFAVEQEHVPGKGLVAALLRY